MRKIVAQSTVTAIVLISLIVLTMSGCSTIKDKIPSFWDDNQSAKVIDIRQSVAQLDCKQTHAPQVKKIKDNIQWLHLYSESKGWRQNDVLRLIKPMEETVDDFYKRSMEKQGSETYCEIKKKLMTTQSDSIASSVLGRF